MAFLLPEMNLQLWLSPKAAQLLIREQGLDCSDQLHVLANKIVDDIFNIMRNFGNKNADEMLDGNKSQS